MTSDTDERFALKSTLELNQLSGIIADASYEIGQTVQKQEGGRRIIDSITSLLINFKLSEVQQFINQIARTSSAFGDVTSLFILEEDTIPEQTLNNIKYIMDGVLEFKKENTSKYAQVSSMKWASYTPGWVQIN